MPDTNQKFVAMPVALVDDAMQIIAAAKHLNYSFTEIANVVSALNHFKGQSAREDGNGSAGEHLRPVESDTSGPAPV